MHRLLWALQILGALLYGASGTMKVFLFDKISQDVPSFGALPRGGWMALGILELLCAVGLVLPAGLKWRPQLTVVAAALLAVEALVFIWVHVQYHEVMPIVMSAVLGLLMAFVAYGRRVLRPIA
jgi:DoxX-like family